MPSLTSLSSNKLKQIRKLKHKKYRAQTNCFLCEGFRLFNTALDTSQLNICELIISDKLQSTRQGLLVQEKAIKRGIDIYKTDEIRLKKISEEVTPSGIVFVVEKDIKSIELLLTLEDKFLLYLDRISEPGNLGSILRTASWFGVRSILLSPECVDPWNPKTVRASAGSIFKSNIFTDIEFTFLRERFKKRGYQFIATVVSDGLPLNKWKIGKKTIICLGQEASGLSKEILKHVDGHINIPGPGDVDSLNLSVATGIILYEATKADT
jgi:TrmH family RNA methyltransferase